MIMNAAPSSGIAVRLLARTFFRRLFESDLMPAGAPQVQLVIWSMALLASPGLLLPGRFSYKYLTLQHQPDALARALLLDRLLFITLTMASLGLVALVVWDGVFPDRRDARILGALPLRSRDLILARLGALGTLALFFCAGLNLIPTVLYGPTVAGFGAARNALTGAGAHLISTTLAGVFVFFSLIAVQGLLLVVAGRRAAERLAFVLQMLLAVVLLQILFFMPVVGSVLPADLQIPAAHPELRWIPSIWFLALYDVLGGRPGGGASPLAFVAVSAAGIAVVGAAGLLAGTHARLMRRALESRDAARRSIIGLLLLRGLSLVQPRDPAAHAAFAFTLRSLARSRRHGMLLALHLGVALALVVSALGPFLLRRGWAGLDAPSVPILSAPLVLLFFTLVGMRALFAIPIEPKANWVWRQHEPANRAAAIAGVQRFLVVAGVLPLAGLGWLIAAALWGPLDAARHGAVCLAMGWLLSEALCLGLAKIPFTCAYLPGRSRINTLWPVYLTVFTNYAYTTASLELELRRHAHATAIFVGVVAIAAAIVHSVRSSWVAAEPGLRFDEEDPRALFEGFHLSEGLAARPRTTREAM